MRHRPVCAAAIAAAVLAVLPASAGGVKVLDGRKTKALTFTDKVTKPQDNDINLVTDQLPTETKLSRPDMATCQPPRCARFSFVYAPAPGVKPKPLSVRLSWKVPGQDYDLYVYDRGYDVGHCGASVGNAEVVRLRRPARNHTYEVVIDHYRAVPDTVTATVTFPAKAKVGDKVPGNPDASGIPVNCGL